VKISAAFSCEKAAVWFRIIECRVRLFTLKKDAVLRDMHVGISSDLGQHEQDLRSGYGLWGKRVMGLHDGG
jgi:hypothetical protein